MIDPITITTSAALATVLTIRTGFKTYNAVNHRREAVANTIIRGYDAHLEEEEIEDVEEFLDKTEFSYKQTDVHYMENKVRRLGLNKEIEAQDESTSSVNNATTLFNFDELLSELDESEVYEYKPGCIYRKDHDYYNYCPVCQEKIHTPIPVETIERELMFDHVSYNKYVEEKDAKFRKEYRTSHSSRLMYLLADVLKAKYVTLEDTKANRIVLRDHITQWYERRSEKHKDIRRIDMIRHVPIAVELFFIPTYFDETAATMYLSSEAQGHHFRAGNPKWFDRAIFAWSPAIWNLLRGPRRSRSDQ